MTRTERRDLSGTTELSSELVRKMTFRWFLISRESILEKIRKYRKARNMLLKLFPSGVRNRNKIQSRIEKQSGDGDIQHLPGHHLHHPAEPPDRLH